MIMWFLSCSVRASQPGLYDKYSNYVITLKGLSQHSKPSDCLSIDLASQVIPSNVLEDDFYKPLSHTDELNRVASRVLDR